MMECSFRPRFTSYVIGENLTGYPLFVAPDSFLPIGKMNVL